MKYLYHIVRVWLFRKQCKCPKDYQAVRARTKERIYYICSICLRGYYHEKR